MPVTEVSLCLSKIKTVSPLELNMALAPVRWLWPDPIARQKAALFWWLIGLAHLSAAFYGLIWGWPTFLRTDPDPWSLVVEIVMLLVIAVMSFRLVIV